jgi:hypothetical protein
MLCVDLIAVGLLGKQNDCDVLRRVLCAARIALENRDEEDLKCFVYEAWQYWKRHQKSEWRIMAELETRYAVPYDVWSRGSRRRAIGLIRLGCWPSGYGWNDDDSIPWASFGTAQTRS